MANTQGPGGPRAGDQRPSLVLTPEEMAVARSERRKTMFGFQLPLGFGSSYGVYMLMRAGILKKSGTEAAPFLRAYLPKCSGAFFVVFTATGFAAVPRIHKKLLAMDGAYSKAIKEMAEIRPNSKPGRSWDASELTTEDVKVSSNNNIIDALTNESTEEELPTKSLTYEDLRRKNRLQETERPQKEQFQHPVPSNTQPAVSTDDPSTPGKKNKYGDSWSES